MSSLKKKKLNSQSPPPIHRTHIPILNHPLDIFEPIPELFNWVPTCLSSNSKFLRGSRSPKRLAFCVKNLRYKPLAKGERSLLCYQPLILNILKMYLFIYHLAKVLLILPLFFVYVFQNTVLISDFPSKIMNEIFISTGYHKTKHSVLCFLTLDGNMNHCGALAYGPVYCGRSQPKLHIAR